MHWFDDQKISVKLFLSFAVGLSFTVILGVFSIFMLDKVNQTATAMQENWLPSVTSLGNVKYAIARYRAAEIQHVLARDAKLQDGYESAMKDLAQYVKKSRDAYEKLISEPQEKAGYAEFVRAFEEYMRQDALIVQASRAGNDTEAVGLLRGSSLAAYTQMEKKLQDLVLVNQEGGAAAAKAGNTTFNNARMTIVALLIAVTAIGALFSVWIARRIAHALQEAVVIAQTVTKGDLTSRIESHSRDEVGQLMQALQSMNASLIHVVSQVRSGTETIATASRQIASGNLDLSSRTEEQASSLEETASSMEELTATVKQNAENARLANDLVLNASDAASKGGAVVSQVVETMASINDSSRKIVDIISVIDGIAFQTNILALNAAVEAARAGEQGRGFAVVASEVRSLAHRSANAAKEIKALIDDSVNKVGAGATLVGQAGETMQEIVQSVKRVTDIMSEISSASHEQTAGIEQINQAISQMDVVTQQNASLVEEAAAAAEAMQDQSVNLAQVVSFFTLDAGASGQGQMPQGRTLQGQKLLT